DLLQLTWDLVQRMDCWIQPWWQLVQLMDDLLQLTGRLVQRMDCWIQPWWQLVQLMDDLLQLTGQLVQMIVIDWLNFVIGTISLLGAGPQSTRRSISG